MSRRPRTGAMLSAVVLATMAPILGASPVPDDMLNMHKLLRREPPKALPQNASAPELRWQPTMDFDKDGCYNTPAMDGTGKITPGLNNMFTGTDTGCRDASDLDNNNVYVRSRCNNGWCVFLYDYYFEKDVALPYLPDVGHRHDWEHIAVFVEGGDRARLVAASAHGGYATRQADEVRWDGDHPKMVYHKDGIGTHCFRFGSEADDGKIENHRGKWFLGSLVSFDGFPSTQLRDRLFSHDFGAATIGIKDSQFQSNIDKARGKDGAPGFDSSKDDGSGGRL
ncbi:hypothetical protein ACKVV1_008208 [Pyricularia oryzae]